MSYFSGGYFFQAQEAKTRRNTNSDNLGILGPKYLLDGSETKSSIVFQYYESIEFVNLTVILLLSPACFLGLAMQLAIANP
jgi:hypothetical protein